MAKANKGGWTCEEHDAFLHGLSLMGKDWAGISAVVLTRSTLQIRTHAQKYFAKIEQGLKFPDKPYPSQYDAAAGRSGFAAGAYMYGAPAKQAVSLYRQSEQPQIVLDWSTQSTPNIGGANLGQAYVPPLYLPEIWNLGDDFCGFSNTYIPPATNQTTKRRSTEPMYSAAVTEQQQETCDKNEEKEYEELIAFTKWLMSV